MLILPGRRLGPYEILSGIGAGGMGEVYKARDTRLDRIVAIKVLPTHLADKPDLRERFEREARTIASLNHPHICTLYDTGRQDGIDYLVMEYLEGETLAQRLVKGSLPLEQVLQYAIEIADALDKAHRKGVTHRDLKPGNIMLTKTGTKLLDFGLAKLKQEVAPANLQLSELPTANDPLTARGTIVGTLQYMAPEQLEGKEVDARTDIFAFGTVVYEMATGKRTFEGKSQASLIAAILEREPPAMSSLQPMTPPALDRLVKRCLPKDPDDRWQTARDLEKDLKWIAEGGSQAGMPAPLVARRKARERLGWAVAALAIVAFLAALVPAILYLRRSISEAQPIRFTIGAPEKTTFQGGPASPWPAVSPDGRQIAFEVSTSGGAFIEVRSLSSLAAQMLTETGQGSLHFWSPDSRYIGFFSEGKLKKVAVSGGPAETLCNATYAGGGTWNSKGAIVFSQTGGLASVSADGGEARALTKVDSTRGESSHVLPRFLPDGKHFLYVVLGSKPENTGIYVGSLDSSSRPVRLLNASSQVEYSSGHLLFVRGNILEAQPFDADRLQLTGDAFPVAEPIGNNPVNGRAALGASPNGVLVYRAYSGTSQLAWVDRARKQLATMGESSPSTHFSLSADEKHAAVTANGDLWLVDLARGTKSRLTFGNLVGEASAWSPDGSRVYFSGNQGGAQGLYQKASDSSGNEELLLRKDGAFPIDVSHDGKFLLYQQAETQTATDLWILPLLGERQPKPFLQSRFDETEGQFSPDGRWIAYVSNETGREEVYVQPFLGAGGKWQVSAAGGEQPRWRRDGKEIFYVSAGKLMAVDVKTEPQFKAGQPRVLFEDPITLPNHNWAAGGNHYAVSADGKRFLVLKQTNAVQDTPLTVVVNWTAGLKK
jgi:Tol biopolymer transport system component/predicted Ser/Thr protein kinase